MKNFNWNEFRKGNIAVHCDTENKANDFLKQCNERNMNWYSNIGSHWKDYQKNTCYDYNYGITYDNLNYYAERDYKIIEWEMEEMKFNWQDFKKGKFIVKINNNNREQFIKEIKKEYKNIENVNHWYYDGEKYYIENGNMDLYETKTISDKSIIDFIPNTNTNNNKYELYITSDGTITNCVYKLNGEIVNKSIAELNTVDEFDFKEGDIVKIIDDKKCFSSYYEWILKNIDDKEILLNWERGLFPRNIIDKKFEIVKKAKHLESDSMIYCIKSLNSYYKIFLFAKNGLKKVD